MNNLESIKKGEVVGQGNLPWNEFKRQLRPRFFIVWRDIALGYLALAAILASLAIGCVLLPLWAAIALAPVAAIGIGYFLAYLNLFIHEASHHNIHPDKKTNDKLANIFLCLPFGMEVNAYRLIHWEHHRLLGTPEDTERSYFNALTGRFILESVTGIRVLRIMLFRSRQVGSKPGMQTAAGKRKARLMLVMGAAFNLALLGALIALGLWPVAAAWVLGMAVFYPFFGSVRQLLEHRDELAPATADFTQVPHGKLSRLFRANLLSNTFGGAGFTRHMIHHWEPNLSYTNFPEAEAFLLTTAACKDILEKSRTTYLRTFRLLLWPPKSTTPAPSAPTQQ